MKKIVGTLILLAVLFSGCYNVQKKYVRGQANNVTITTTDENHAATSRTIANAKVSDLVKTGLDERLAMRVMSNGDSVEIATTKMYYSVKVIIIIVVILYLAIAIITGDWFFVFMLFDTAGDGVDFDDW